MSILDEAEYLRLEEAVAVAERILGVGKDLADSTSMLVAFVEDAKGRMSLLEEQELDSEGRNRKEEKIREAVGVVFLVQRELELTVVECQQYGYFLKKECFTRSDFDALDQFYEGAWSKLSAEGKAQMSNRLWEGVRRGEYEFTELPENPKRREAEWLYQALLREGELAENLQQIPAEDRQEFIRNYGEGDMEAAYEVLNRDSFCENVSVCAPALKQVTLSAEEAQELAYCGERLKEERAPPTELPLSLLGNGGVKFGRSD